MLFKYPLTDSQYARFQHANNNAQIQALGRQAGVEITDEKIVGGIETMYFRGRCSGTMALVPCIVNGESIAEVAKRTGKTVPIDSAGHPYYAAVVARHHWECWIQVRSKPWWLPWFVLDWGFREALK